MGTLLHLTLLLSAISFVTACNITAVLNNSNCNIFSSMISQTGVIKSYLTAQKSTGLTLFAPSNDAFKEQRTPDLSHLTNAELVSLLNYHAIPKYIPKEKLKTMTKNYISTLATNLREKYDLMVRTDGDDNVTMDTGIDYGKIVSTAVDETPVCVFVLDRILLPVEIFGNATSPRPGPAQAPDAPEDGAPAPKKSGESEAKGVGVRRAVVAVAVSVILMVFLF